MNPGNPRSAHRRTGGSSLARVTPLLLAVVAGAALASPVVPLRDTTLGTQGDFGRGCAFVGNQLQCWGGDSSGSLDIGATALESLTTHMRRPDTPSGDFDRPTSLVATDRTCLTDAAGVWCWGRNERGQLGLGDRVNRAQPEHLPGLPADVVEVVLGLYHACARTMASGLWCWGGNTFGETGQVPGAPVQDPITNVVMSPPQTRALAVPGLPATPSAVGLGYLFSCALVQGRVWCWGNNEQGQLGDGSQVARALPAPVSGLPAIIQHIAVGSQHACAIDGAGDVWCWGNNQFAQIGVAASMARRIEPLPLRVKFLGGPATDLHLELTQSCALVGSDRKCWGISTIDGTNGPNPQLTARPEGAPADWLDDCFLRAGELQCPLTSTRHPNTTLDARAVPGLAGRPAQLALGRDYACARMPDESVWCWGINSRGQLGQGDLNPRSQAVRVQLPPTQQIAAGTTHACAATSDGLWCWGSNGSAELGDGSMVDRPAPVRSMFAATLIAAGEGYTCAYASGSGGLRCWGRNDTGQVSGQVSETVIAGAQPLGAAAIRELSAGLSHTCAVLQLAAASSETRCWGRLATNEAELGTFLTDFSPRLIVAGNPVPADALTTLQSSGFTTCAGDRCFGMSYLPPERGVFHVDQLLVPPMPSPRAFALGSRLACVQGVGTDVRCSALTNRACQFESFARLLLTPGQMIGCQFFEALISAAERDWIRVVGLPSPPSLLQGGEQYACAVLAEGTRCWGPRVPLGTANGGYGPVYRAGAIEPAPTVAVPLDPTRACPAYLVASVSLLDPSAPDAAGAWGQEILLGSGRRFLNGGLNFGGFGSTAGSGVPGYAAFSINNPERSEQAVTLELEGDGGEFTLTVESTVPPSTERVEVLREQVTLTGAPLQRRVNLRNGFHIVVLQPVSGTRLFLAGIGTTTLDGGPAAFQGGAVVGGYLGGDQTGFSGICTDDANSVSIRTEARSSRGLIGAGDLRLRLIEGQTGALLHDSAPGQ